MAFVPVQSRPGTGARSALAPTPRSTVRRLRERASRDRRLIDAVLDEGLLCHVGFDAGRGTVVLPMAYGRLGDALYLHGALGNDMLSALGGGLEACLSVTLLDGLVLARSQFHHSVNYRSVVLFGRAVAVTDDDERRRALEAIVDHVAPGRAGEARPPDPGELRRTRVVRFPIEEGSAKVRAGGPVEEEADLSLDVWAGVLPLRLETDDPVTDPAVSSPLPASVVGYRRPPRNPVASPAPAAPPAPAG